MRLCYVTDRKALAGPADQQIRLLLEKMESAALAGVDWIQIREKDLPAREVAVLASEAVRRIPRSCRILVNDRLDVAMAAGAGGVHLGEQSIPVEEAKRLMRERNLGGNFLVGVSTHSLESLLETAKGGADYGIFGPVYGTPTKTAFGAPQGLRRLEEACRSVSMPVLAIGGITIENAHECVAAGASGIAAIRMFQDAGDLAVLLRALRQGRKT
jgi:thiamine-phosphate pyrophosphorylase